MWGSEMDRLWWTIIEEHIAPSEMYADSQKKFLEPDKHTSRFDAFFTAPRILIDVLSIKLIFIFAKLYLLSIGLVKKLKHVSDKCEYI